MKKITFLLISAILLVCAYIFAAAPLLSLFVGFSAKTACSCHFIQGRSLDDIRNYELAPASFVKNSIDVDKKMSSSSFLTIKRQAVYKEDLGCTLISEIDPKIIQSQSFSNLNADTSSFEFNVSTKNNAKLNSIVNRAFEEPNKDKSVNTRAIIVIKDGELIAEKYANGYDRETPFMGWSMTKSITNALVGILVKNNAIDIYQAGVVDEWLKDNNDKRGKITLDHLLRMSTGLEFEETYNRYSDVNKMLWAKADAGKVAYEQSLLHPIDTKWAYSSGTTNIISHIIRQQFQDYESYVRFPYDSLFNRIGMSTAKMETDANGTFVGSSLMWASALDWTKFALLYLQDGIWDGVRILPEGWVDYSRTRTSTESNGMYAAHFWTNAITEPEFADYPKHWEDVPEDAYYMSGFEGQNVVIIPSLQLIVSRTGQTLDRSAWDIGTFVAEVIDAIE